MTAMGLGIFKLYSETDPSRYIEGEKRHLRERLAEWTGGPVETYPFHSLLLTDEERYADVLTMVKTACRRASAVHFDLSGMAVEYTRKAWINTDGYGYGVTNQELQFVLTDDEVFAKTTFYRHGVVVDRHAVRFAYAPDEEHSRWAA